MDVNVLLVIFGGIAVVGMAWYLWLLHSRGAKDESTAAPLPQDDVFEFDDDVEDDVEIFDVDEENKKVKV